MFLDIVFTPRILQRDGVWGEQRDRITVDIKAVACCLDDFLGTKIKDQRFVADLMVGLYGIADGIIVD